MAYPKARGRHIPGQKNQLEEDYGKELQRQKDIGEIVWFAFEPVKIQLAPKTTICPDYMIQYSDGTMGFDECKGFWQEDAWVKYKLAQAMLPMFRWRIITRPKKKEPFIVEEYAA